jgi:FKBP-type peptidyl-prolyl cis-trans isomerase (trigger factor)
MPDNKNFTIAKVSKLPEAEAEITGEISLPFLVACRSEALESLGKSVSLPGFRAGHIPEDVLVKKVGEMRVLEESAEIALAREYQGILEEAKLSPIGRPEISIVKLAPGIALEFKIRVHLEPEFELPDYKAISSEIMKGKDDIEVSDKEVQEVLEEIQKREVKADLEEGETLEGKIKENLLEEKKFRAREKKRLKIVEELVKKTDIAVPKVLVESELIKMLAQFKDDVERMGMKWEAYLAEAKKTEEDIKNEWKDQALQRVKAELIVIKIAETEKLEPDEKELEHEAKHILSHYPDADPLRARLFAYTQIRNAKVMEFLELVD